MNEVNNAVEFEEDEATSLKAEEFQDLERLGEGAGGTVTKVCHIPTGNIMAKKVCIGRKRCRKKTDCLLGKGLDNRYRDRVMSFD